MVPVLDTDKKPLMPCTEKRARLLLERKQAKVLWQHGIFCIKLLKEPSDRKYQNVALGIDPGSKREGYTVTTETKVVINLTSNTPDWVKNKLEARKNLRKSRRRRKTPYRKMRANRSSSFRKKIKNWCPPSTKARYDRKLYILSILNKLFKITHLNIEDISAPTKEKQNQWNKNFGPLQQGKKYFYDKIKEKYSNIILKLSKGHETFNHRNKRKFKKLTGKYKMEYVWESHNVDSHSLCEIILNKKIIPYRGMYQITYLNFYKRQLHKQQFSSKNYRMPYGGTISLNFSRGSVVILKNVLYTIGGWSKGEGLTLNPVFKNKNKKDNRKRITRIKNIKLLYITKTLIKRIK